MTKYNFLCVDIGTTSLKAALVSDNGQVLSFSRISYNSENTRQLSEQWLKAFKIAIEEIRDNSKFKIKEPINNKTIKNPLPIHAISISGNGPTIITEDGSTFLWNEKIKAKKSIQKKLAPSLFLPRIEYFKSKYPSLFINKKIFSGPEYLIWKLTNSHITILPEDRYKAAYWTEQKIESINLNPSQFGTYINTGAIAGTLTKAMAEELSLPEVPVVAGGPDFTVAIIGTNTLEPGKMCDCAGSSEGINLCTNIPVYKKGLRTLPSVIPGLWNIASLLQSSGRKFVECKIKREKKIGQKLTYLEYISHCAKNPKSNGYRKMTKLAKKIKKGINLVIQCAKENNLPFDDTMMVTGGQSKNEWWMQLKSDITKYKYCVTEVYDSELIGNAVLCAYALGLYDSILQAANHIVKQKKVYIPNKNFNNKSKGKK